MKLRENKELITRIVSGGLSLGLVIGGFAAGRWTSKPTSSVTSTVDSFDETKYDSMLAEAIDTMQKSGNSSVDKSLEEYIDRRDALQKEIDELKAKKQELQNTRTLDVDSLIVMENKNVDGKSELYILETVDYASGICYEYHRDFIGGYRLHQPTGSHTELCGNIIHFDECTPLFNYLTDDEIQMITKNNGKVTTLELDEILARIRKEYHLENEKGEKTF